ncbi:MAG: hypothetical protein H6617_07365 [Bdellovibrionaceae bacterium]|nr:hypothetical protein [Bdellovibrionales bacterium]MCB9254486.1 hypothetical protein [Pseudobdellovibrionaceae bacterium]
MQKRSYLIVLGLAVLIGVGVSVRAQHNAASNFGQNGYLVAESDGYDDAYGSDSSTSEDSGTTTTDTGTTDSGTSNDDYSSEDF